MEGAVGKISMVEPSDGKHAHKVEQESSTESEPTPANKQYKQTSKVEKDVWHQPRKIEAAAFFRFLIFRQVVGICPLADCFENSGESVHSKYGVCLG